ncbi:MAG TPA: dihydrofolate reductase [Arachidicoccus sp.]
MAVSANGQILSSGENYKVPVEIVQDCIALAHQSGNMVLGLKTFRSFFSNPNAKEVLKGIEVAVLSTSHKEDTDGVTFLDSIEAVMDFYQSKGHSKIFVAGGTYTYQSFVNNGYADEFYLTFIPAITGNGAPLITEPDLYKDLTFIESKNITDHIIQLHYRVNSSS